MIQDEDMMRKIEDVRNFLQDGHRIEISFIRDRAKASDMLGLIMKVTAEIKDLCKPVDLPGGLAAVDGKQTHKIKLKKLLLKIYFWQKKSKTNKIAMKFQNFD